MQAISARRTCHRHPRHSCFAAFWPARSKARKQGPFMSAAGTITLMLEEIFGDASVTHEPYTAQAMSQYRCLKSIHCKKKGSRALQPLNTLQVLLTHDHPLHSTTAFLPAATLLHTSVTYKKCCIQEVLHTRSVLLPLCDVCRGVALIDSIHALPSKLQIALSSRGREKAEECSRYCQPGRLQYESILEIFDNHRAVTLYK